MSSAISSPSVNNNLSDPEEDIPDELAYTPQRSLSAPQSSNYNKDSAFFSYRRDNIEIVEKIGMEVQQCGFHCFYDLCGEMTGYHFMTALIQKILNCSVFVPIITMESILKLTQVDIQTTDITLVEYLIALSRRGVDQYLPIVIGEDMRDHNNLVAYSNLFRNKEYQECRKQLAQVVPEACVEKARAALKTAGLDMPESVSQLTVRQIWDHLVTDMDCYILSCAKQDVKAFIQAYVVPRLRGAMERVNQAFEEELRFMPSTQDSQHFSSQAPCARQDLKSPALYTPRDPRPILSPTSSSTTPRQANVPGQQKGVSRSTEQPHARKLLSPRKRSASVRLAADPVDRKSSQKVLLASQQKYGQGAVPDVKFPKGTVSKTPLEGTVQTHSPFQGKQESEGQAFFIVAVSESFGEQFCPSQFYKAISPLTSKFFFCREFSVIFKAAVSDYKVGYSVTTLLLPGGPYLLEI